MYTYIQKFNDQLNLVIALNPEFPQLDILESISSSTQHLLKHKHCCCDFLAHQEMLVDLTVFFLDNRSSLICADQLLVILEQMAVFLSQNEELLTQIKGS